jgi:hypothetical protein
MPAVSEEEDSSEKEVGGEDVFGSVILSLFFVGDDE